MFMTGRCVMGRRVLVALVAALLLVTAACGDDDGGDAADTTTTTAQATTSTTAADATTTTVAAPEDADAAFAVAFCEAWGEGERNPDDVLALMTEDAVAVDMTARVEYTGPDEIRAWIQDPELTVLDAMACGNEAVTARGWAAYGYAMSSSTQPGGTEGVGVVHLDQDGNVDRFLAYSTGVEGEPSAPNMLSEADVAVVDEYRRSYADRDEDAFVAVVSDDFVRYISPTGLSAPAFPGLDGYRTWAEDTEGQNLTVDMGEVAVGDGPWVAHADIWFDADGKELTGGICLVEVVDGKANRHYLHYA
jgi:hypothetical protein